MKTELQNKLVEFQKSLSSANDNLIKKLGSANLNPELGVLEALLNNAELTSALAELEADDIFKVNAVAFAASVLDEILKITIKFYIALIKAENLFHKYSPNRLRIQDRVPQKKWIQNVLQLSEQYSIPAILLQEVYEVAKPSAVLIPDWKEQSVSNPKFPEKVPLSELERERLEALSKINPNDEKLTGAQQKAVANYVETLKAGVEKIPPEIMRKRLERANPKLCLLFPPSKDPDGDLNKLAKIAEEERIKKRTSPVSQKSRRKRIKTNNYPGMFNAESPVKPASLTMQLRSSRAENKP